METVYFELNHWWAGDTYPDAEPFVSWMNDSYKTEEDEEKSWIKEFEKLEPYCKENQLVMAVSHVDMSVNFCVTAKKEWVKANCPELLTKYTEFLRTEEDKSLPFGDFGCPFLEFSQENIGPHYFELKDGEYVEYIEENN